MTRRIVLVRLCGTVVAGALACGCKGEPVFDASGVVTEAPAEVPELGGRGVWIRHDGLHFTVEGKPVILDAKQRTPFRVPATLAEGELKSGNRSGFWYRVRQGRGFPYEIVAARKLGAE